MAKYFNTTLSGSMLPDGDFSLDTSSSMIDAGQDTSSYGVVEDYEGTPRPVGLGYDIGAFESW